MPRKGEIGSGIIREGAIFLDSHGNPLKVIKYEKYSKVLVCLSSGFQKLVAGNEILRSSIKDPLYRSVYGIGYLGVGNYRAYKNSKQTKEYSTWFGIMTRGYCPIWKEKHKHYKDCYVGDSWHNFQNFAEWYNSVKYIERGWALDKDLLYRGNLKYSEETCVFLPRILNNSITRRDVSHEGELPNGVYYNKNKSKYIAQVKNGGVNQKYLGMFDDPWEAFLEYKNHKEKYLKFLANKWKDQIDPRAYDALMNYEVLPFF